MYRNGIKRLLAVILSLGGMICLSPLLLVLCIAIKLDSPGPVFFKQKRVGIHKQHFNILKFRTSTCRSRWSRACWTLCSVC